MSQQPMSDNALVKLQRDTFGYFKHETNLANGMVADNTRKGSHASIAAIGLGLAAYPIGVEQDFIAREEAADRVLRTLRFFWHSPQGKEADATGYKGSTTTSCTRTPGGARGSANFRRSTRPSSSPVRWRLRLTSIKTTNQNIRLGNLLMICIDESSGIGRLIGTGKS